MRRILVDYARKHRAARRGGGISPGFLEDNAPAAERSEMLVALDEAFERPTRLSERLNRVVECRFFGGLSEEETAEALGVTARTVERDWAKASLEALRRMSPEQKLAVASQLRRTAWEFAAAGMRARHPDLPAHEIDALVRSLFLGG